MATVTSFSNVTDAEFVARAHALAPKLRERSEATNALGRVPRETVDEMLDAGLFTLFQPKRFGGTERGLVPFLDCVTALGSGCGSAGWVYSVVEVHSFHLALFGLDAQEDVWGDNHFKILGSSYMPGGKATPAPGGYRISGHWKFSSGCDNVEWFILGGLVPPEGEGKTPTPWYFLLPAKDVRIHHDSWKVVGLTGTGSKDVSVEDAFVPRHRMLLMQEAYDGVSPGSKINPYPLYHLPMMSVFPLCLSAPSVGVAKGAIARYIEMMKSFTTKSRGQTVADFHNSQMRLAEASALVDSAELLLQRDVRATMEIRASGRQLTVEERVRNRRDHAWAADTCVRAVDLLYKMTGGGGLHEGNALLRSFRDAHAIGMHLGNNWDVAGPLYGSVMLGRPPNAPTY
jgi:3-hydroxy-9,10-secoandrosta-1,3,5(10)-triene-9,17-dione monooxygenase